MPSEIHTENKMGTMPINRLLITMSLPMIISMLVQAMYNIVDSIFVSRIDENALAAVSLAFPVQNLMIAVSVGTCVGVNALLSRLLGERKRKEANMSAENGVFLAFMSYAVFAVLGLLFSHAFFAAQTDNQQIILYGRQYLTICTVASFGLFGEMMFERLLQATGRTIYNMATQGVGAIINIILDPILIFGLFGAPRMGIAGAAVATVTGQIIAFFLAANFNRKKNSDITVSLKGFKPSRRMIGQIYEVGIPTIIMQSIGSVMTLGINNILIVFSATAVSVFGIYFKLQSFVFMPIFGLNNGMVPIIAYNYGARKKKRITQTIKLSVGIATGIMLAGLLVFQLLTRELLLLFKASDQMLEIGIPALRLISLSFIFAGFCIIAGSVFQALGNGVYSLIVSAARQLVCILPLAYVFSHAFGLHAVWYAFPLAELISVATSGFLLRKIYLAKIAPLADE